MSSTGETSEAIAEAPAPPHARDSSRLPFPPYLRGARAAFVFLTRIPVGGFPYAREDFHWAPAYFPFVGLVVGMLGTAVLVLHPLVGAWPAATLAVITTAFCTGAFHEDGLADTADAFGGSHGGKKVLEILKDSRIGAFGALSLVLSQLLRVALLAELLAPDLPAYLAWTGLPLAHVLGRTGPVWLMATLPYVTGPEAKGSTVAEGKKRGPALIATAFAGAVLGLSSVAGLDARLALAAIVATVVVAVVLGRWYRRKLGGLAGDLLGAQEQATEIIVLLAILGVARALAA